MPRFVLLHHECPPDLEKPSHWDFMLEVEGVLWTWELRELPAAWATILGCETALRQSVQGLTAIDARVPVTRLADHRLAYLDYEGAVSRNRGSVTRVDGGNFEWLLQSARLIEARLDGERLCGIISLHCENEWQLLAE